MISNICVIGHLGKYTKSIAKCVADTLEMFYVDVPELLEYELDDLANAQLIVGKEYIEVQEDKLIDRVTHYINTIFTIDNSYLSNAYKIKCIKKSSLIVYLKLTKTELKRLINLENLTKQESDLILKLSSSRNDIYESYADVVVDIDSQEKTVQKIINKIEEYYEK